MELDTELAAANSAVKPSITFLYPSRAIGGAQLLFARLAEAIAAGGMARVSIVDYEDGFSTKYLKDNPDVSTIAYIEGLTDLHDTTVIVPLSHLIELRYMLTPASLACNFLFWSIHPDNIKYMFYGYGRNWFGGKDRARALLRQLCDEGHILFMDRANRRACEDEIGSQGCSSFLQIPIGIPAGRRLGQRASAANMSIAWLGRITYDKINSLKKIVDDAADYQAQTKIDLHIIGAGPEEKALLAHAQKKGVALHLHGILQGQELHDFFVNRVDFGIAMGTSALEIAALGIPVALIDYSLKPLPPDMKYDWLYDTRDFTLGNDCQWGEPRAKTFGDLIGHVRADSRNEIGGQCFAYVKDHHCLPQVAAKLVSYVNQGAPIDERKIKEVERLLNPEMHSFLYGTARAIKRVVKRSCMAVLHGKAARDGA
jgi:hypothetical protein